MKSCTISKLTPPDGGWGYIIALSVAFAYCTTFMPMVTFGIVFGSFLQEIGDEASNTALVTGIYLGVQWFTGLVANPLLQKYSYRKIGLAGATSYFVGATLTIFASDLYQFITFFAIVQAFGYGLILPSMLTAFNAYFDKRRTFVFNVLNAFVMIFITTNPALASFFMRTFGFRGTLVIFAGMGLNCFPAMLCLQPVKWHMEKIEVTAQNSALETIEEEVCVVSKVPCDSKEDKSESGCLSQLRSIAKSMDLALLKEPVYLNVAIGVALCISADYTFLSVFPLILNNYNITGQDATLIMTIFYTSDVLGRIFVSVLVAFINLKSRYMILTGAILTVLFRIGFLLHHTFWWVAVFSALLGSLRCLFQTMFGIVFGELYPDRFVAAFSLFMVISGIISLSSGFLMSAVKTATNDNEMIVHILTLMYGLCAVPWIIELVYLKLKIFKCR